MGIEGNIQPGNAQRIAQAEEKIRRRFPAHARAVQHHGVTLAGDEVAVLRAYGNAEDPQRVVLLPEIHFPTLIEEKYRLQGLRPFGRFRSRCREHGKEQRSQQSGGCPKIRAFSGHEFLSSFRRTESGSRTLTSIVTDGRKACQ